MKFKIYAEVVVRIIIIFIGYLFAAVFFLFSIIGALGDIYLTAFTSFVTSTKSLIQLFDQQLKKTE